MLIHVEVTEDVYKALSEAAEEVDAQVGNYCAALLIDYVAAPPQEKINALEATIRAQKKRIEKLVIMIAELELAAEVKESDTE